MGGCSGSGRCYMLTAAGILKIVALAIGAAPAILAFILHAHYAVNPRPESLPHIKIPKGHREKWELAFLIILAGAFGVTLINLLLYSVCKCLSRNTWTKRFDCGYFAFVGGAQATMGFIMLGSALSSSDDEPVELKWAAGFLGILTGIIYWGTATLVNRD